MIIKLFPISYRAVENVQKKLKTTKENLKLRLEYMHPVLCRIRPWMRDKLRKAEAKFIEECQWSAHEEALVLCNNNRLSQTVYFLNRDLTFMKEVNKLLARYEIIINTCMNVYIIFFRESRFY